MRARNTRASAEREKKKLKRLLEFLKAMLHGAVFFFANYVATNVVLQVTGTISRTCIAIKYWERETPPLQLAMFFSRQRWVARCKN